MFVCVLPIGDCSFDPTGLQLGSMDSEFCREWPGHKKTDSDTLEKKTIFLRGEDFQWRSQSSLWDGASIYIYKSECLSVYCQLETTVLILLGSNWVQWLQNFVENDLGTKKSDLDTLEKKAFFWGVRIFNGEAKTHSGLGPLSIQGVPNETHNLANFNFKTT